MNNNIFEENTGFLKLSSNHPGLHDPIYRQRRTDFYKLALQHREQNKPLPIIDYTESENAIWSKINQQLAKAHQEKACSIYLRGKERLGLSANQLPQISLLNEQLMNSHQVSLAPAEGVIDDRGFFRYLANRTMPCTIFLRHDGDPNYTPEPDIVHDVLGHVPPLMDPEYAELMQLIGLAASNANEKDLVAWARVYWFSIEFGLIQEGDDLKVFGAGLLSSSGEMEYCFSNEVERRPFEIEDVMATDYDNSQMQKILFYIPSFEFLKNQIKKLVR